MSRTYFSCIVQNNPFLRGLLGKAVETLPTRRADHPRYFPRESATRVPVNEKLLFRQLDDPSPVLETTIPFQDGELSQVKLRGAI
jgi:hypothetical protein